MSFGLSHLAGCWTCNSIGAYSAYLLLIHMSLCTPDALPFVHCPRIYVPFSRVNYITMNWRLISVLARGLICNGLSLTAQPFLELESKNCLAARTSMSVSIEFYLPLQIDSPNIVCSRIRLNWRVRLIYRVQVTKEPPREAVLIGLARVMPPDFGVAFPESWSTCILPNAAPRAA